MDSKKLLLAAGLSLAVLILWEWIVPKPARQPPVQTTRSVSSATAPAPPQAPAEAAPVSGEAVSAREESLVTLENGFIRATFSNRGAILTSLILKRYTDGQGRPLELVRAAAPPAPRPLALSFDGNEAATQRAAAALYAVETGSAQELRFRFSEGSLAITKEVRLREGYLFDVKVSVSGPPYTLLAGSGLRNVTVKEKASSFVQPTTAIATVGNGFERVREDKASAPQTWPLPEGGFAGLEDNYFLAVLLPRQASAVRVFPVALPAAPPAKATAAVAAGVTGKGTLALRAYYGPKDLEVLEGLKLGLERAVNLGWWGFGIVARPLLLLLKWTYSWIGNYGLAILFVTLLIRIALFPLTHKSYSSMKKMQKLAPKMNAIRDKYKKAKTDAAQRAKMNQELMALYQAEGYNPMSGCFPMLLQLPILIAFYNVLSRSIELRHAPFMLWIRDLSAVDPTYILVIVMIVTMYVQQAMTPSTLDPVQKKIFMAMPVIWGFFLKDMPSGLVLYWLFSNVLTIFQQMIIKRMGNKEEVKPDPQRPGGARVKKARAG